MPRVFLIHGWSVRSTSTYRALHKQLARNGYELEEVHLGRYVSLDNDIELRDISRALHNELLRLMGRPPWPETFHIITHSTGALVAKEWIREHYVDEACQGRPFRNLIFLAGPHFGSRLAHHGRSMLAYAIYLGETGREILKALELGSDFSWENNGAWLDPSTWKEKGIRPFCLIGDRVKRNPLKSRIFPAGYEAGSDMVVRAAAGNLNFRRYELEGATGRFRRLGQIKGVPYASLWRYLHSGEDAGIMSSIQASADPSEDKYQNLRLILDCLAVSSPSDYAHVRQRLELATSETAAKRKPYTQLDFRFRDESGAPVDDYRFTLGYFDGDRKKASEAVEDVHKNRVAPNHFTAFIRHDKIDPEAGYFLEFLGKTDSPLYDFEPSPLTRRVQGVRLQAILSANETTQIDIVLRREAARQLFVFHPGNDENLHVRWDRRGEIIK